MSASTCQAKDPSKCRYHNNPATYVGVEEERNFIPTIITPNVSLKKLIPRNKDADWRRYYEDTDRKHFTDKTSAGSKFLNPHLTSLEDLVKLRLHQKPEEGLAGDDKETLIALGSDEDGFMPGTRYLIVRTLGTVGIIHSSELPGEQLVKIERTKHKAPVSVTTVVNQQPTVDYGVLIISDTLNETHPTLVTAFPGPVIKPSKDDRLEQMEGQQLSLKLVKHFLNVDNLWITTKTR